MIMKRITDITTGILNQFSLFYGDVDIDYSKEREAYDLLEDEIENDMKDSPELWSGEFICNGKRYAIIGDGALTSDGEYVVARILG